MASHLTTGEEELVRLVLVELALDGYSYNRLTTPLPTFWASVLTSLSGSSYSALTTTEVALLAGIANLVTVGGYSHLRHGRAELLAAILTGLESGGVSPVSPSFQPSLDFSDARNSQYIPLVF